MPDKELEEVAENIKKVIPKGKMCFILVVDEFTEEYRIVSDICTVCVVKNLIDYIITYDIKHSEREEVKH